MVADLNVLLGNADYWTPGAREAAARHGLHARAIAAFYDELQSALSDPWDKREQLIRLPTEAGASVVLLAGPTGVGKTTLVRQLIGTDPDEERFPSTSTSRTTIFDTEIICRPGPFEAVVSFLSRDRTRAYVEECVEAAITNSAEGRPSEVIVRAFLEHSEQRFRLSYLLGKPTSRATIATDEDDEETAGSPQIQGALTPAEREVNARAIEAWIVRCCEIAKTIVTDLQEELQTPVEALTAKDKDAFLELIEAKLHDNERAQEVVDEVLEAVEARFRFIEDVGTLDKDSFGWPTRWHWLTVDRAAFMHQIGRFSSNFEPDFGRLLTPVVEGLRVAAPFRPSGSTEEDAIPQLVLLDTEGMGHVRSTSAQAPTSLTRRFDVAHAILLVDTAETPMTAGSQALLRSIAGSGHERKLGIVFTHFDQVKGANFGSPEDKRDHVLASLEQAISGLDDAFGTQSGASRRLRRHLDGHVFFMGRIHEALDDRAKGTRKALRSLVDFAVQAGQPQAATEVLPCYDIANLVLCVRTATHLFQSHWNARLGLAHLDGIRPEHWTRVQALTRRFASQWSDQYDTLQPVAHLFQLMKEKVAAFVANPRSWEPAHATQDAKDKAVELVSQHFFKHLREYLSRRFRQDQLKSWCDAYARHGQGSGRARARDVRAIDEEVAPIPGETPTALANQVLDDIRSMFAETLREVGGKTIPA